MIKQIEINIDYILMLVKKYHDSHGEDKEVLIDIKKAIDSSPELRSKKALIETFINGINDIDDVMIEWQNYVSRMRKSELDDIIGQENLKEDETRKFMSNAFRDGELKTTGTDIDKIMPAVSRFGGGRATKKQGIIYRLQAFFEKFYGIGIGNLLDDEEPDDSKMKVEEYITPQGSIKYVEPEAYFPKEIRNIFNDDDDGN